MDENRKKELIADFEYSFKGHKATVAGWANDYATVTTRMPGFCNATWEEIESAALFKNGVIENVWLTSQAWLGSIC